METGILHLKKKPRHILKDGRRIDIRKQVSEIPLEFDKQECQFEGVPASNIIVGGVTYSADMQIIEAKKAEVKESAELANKYSNIIKKQAEGHDSFRLDKSCIPLDTRKSLIDDIDNFSLKFNKFARFEKNEVDITKSKFEFFKTNRGKIEYKIDANNFGLGKDKNQSNLILEQLNERHKRNALSLFWDGSFVSDVFVSNYRLVVGLGGPCVYETSITLHHIYGIPYIPATSIKGVVRSWIIQSVFNFDEKAALKHPDFCNWFGSQSNSGGFVFFDAFPTQLPNIEPDIMNVHYPKYYNGSEPPTDTQSPIPVVFLTVVDTPFMFLIGSKHSKLTESKIENKTIGEWLIEVLSEHGIGAKTAVGYGYMQEVKK
jgi:CRISPR-associated protein Cmr6